MKKSTQLGRVAFLRGMFNFSTRDEKKDPSLKLAPPGRQCAPSDEGDGQGQGQQDDVFVRVLPKQRISSVVQLRTWGIN